MGHLNSYLARGGGNLKRNFPKIQISWSCPGEGDVDQKPRFDWYMNETKPLVYEIFHRTNLYDLRLEILLTTRREEILVGKYF